MPTSPTSIVLEDLVNNPNSRVGGEFWLYYNLGQAYKYGSVGVATTGSGQYRAQPVCNSQLALPTSGFAIVRARTPLGGAVETTWGVTGHTAKLPAYAPPGQSAEIGQLIPTPTQSNIVATGANVAGDSVDIIVLPNPSDNQLLCYDQGMNIETGDEQRAIARKFELVDHYVRQRPANTLSIGDLYCHNLKGLASLRNRNCTLIGKFYPNGGSVPSEIYYFTNVRLNVPRQIPEDSNESVKVQATGTFNEYIVFTEPES